jgi:hypothetical protein
MAKQSEIPGTERKKVKRIEDKMEVLADAKKSMTKARNKHKDAELEAINAIRDEGLPEYTSLDLGLTLKVEDQPHCTLKAYKPEAAEAEA